VPTQRCPVCRTAVAAESRHRPFCSERCRLLDLSAWVSERYRFPGDPFTPRDASDDDEPA
jgi:endogenous inhibitor of DNA gyrase (YacG/DUF329 family)